MSYESVLSGTKQNKYPETRRLDYRHLESEPCAQIVH